MSRMRKVNDTDVLDADSWQLFFCGHCPSGHVVFFDEHNKPLLHATFSAAQARGLAKRIADNDPNFKPIGEAEDEQ